MIAPLSIEATDLLLRDNLDFLPNHLLQRINIISIITLAYIFYLRSFTLVSREITEEQYEQLKKDFELKNIWENNSDKTINEQIDLLREESMDKIRNEAIMKSPGFRKYEETKRRHKIKSIEKLS